jgi:hypothetical protein
LEFKQCDRGTRPFSGGCACRSSTFFGERIYTPAVDRPLPWGRLPVREYWRRSVGVVKLLRVHGGCLGIERRRRTS